MVAVGPHTAVMIKPGCRHRAVGNLKLFNISVPKGDPHFDAFDTGTEQMALSRSLSLADREYVKLDGPEPLTLKITRKT